MSQKSVLSPIRLPDAFPGQDQDPSNETIAGTHLMNQLLFLVNEMDVSGDDSLPLAT